MTELRGVVNICGTGFSLDGTPIGYGAVGATSGILSGTLFSGDSFRREFLRFQDAGTINLIEMEVVPALGAVLLGMLGLCVVGIKLRKLM